MFSVGRLSRIALTAFLLGSSNTDAAFELGLGDDSDLTDFVTRPDIKAPILNVTKYHPDRVSPGYIFTAPYVRIYQEAWATSYYQPCQSGPHIYDNDGNLVWSGACRFINRNQADFRPILFNGSWHLSSIDMGLEWDRRNDFGGGNTTGRGFIMDDTYNIKAQMRMPKNVDNFNMHEFRLVDDGKSALAIVVKPEYTDVSMLEGVRREGGWVDNMGFIEVEVNTGKTHFRWMALDHISLTESTTKPEDLQGPLPDAWDFFHLDSVDKTADGDYLVSSRHTDTIYKISRKDGSIQWRLGGAKSDFRLQDFTFSRQHDARSLDPKQLPFQARKGTEYISLFNNAADETDPSPQSPSMLILALDPKHRVARVVRRVARPDGQATLFSGNGHFLPNGNLFSSWAGNSYISEHDTVDDHNDDGSNGDDRTVMEARFLSDRFTTYRAFKSAFAARPSESPALVCSAYGTTRARATTVCWVSWNGATEVREWRFRAARSTSAGQEEEGEEGKGKGEKKGEKGTSSSSLSSPSSSPSSPSSSSSASSSQDPDAEEDDPILGTVERTGFETRIQARGYVAAVVAEALDGEGRVLGRSERRAVRVVQPWQD